jgi:hypothetical protein
MPSLKQRTLKIEAIGDFARGRIKPRIRLTGCWLDRAGFKPGQRVEVYLPRPGEMTLQLKEEAPAIGGPQPF